MDFDFNKFMNALEQEGLSRQEAGMRIYQEVRKAENQKEGFLDQAQEHPEFYTQISRQIDNYVTLLKLAHNRLSPTPQEPDQELFLSEQPELERIEQLLERIEEAERRRNTKQ